MPGTESTSPAAPDESGLSLEPIASDSEASSPIAPSESGLSLEPTVPGTESTSPAAPDESDLLLEPTAPGTESTSPIAPTESGLSLEANAPDSEFSSLATKTEEPQPEPFSDHSVLSLEDELERDLARIMESEQQQPSLEAETSDAPSSTTGELDFDLSSPDALEIHFEETDKASEQDNSGQKNSKL